VGQGRFGRGPSNCALKWWAVGPKRA